MSQPKIRIVSGWNVPIIKLGIWLNIVFVALTESRSLKQLSRLIDSILYEKKVIYGNRKINKLVKSSQGYQFGLNVPPWPSRAFNKFFRFTLRKIQNSPQLLPGSARMVLMGITKKCPLNCEHCYEWDEINKKEVLTDQDLVETVRKYADLGAALFWLGGGEPLSRLQGIHQILDHAPADISVWLSTSGYGLTKEKARTLQKEGLTGIIVSIDHFEEDQHNDFRGNRKSFEKALAAIKAGLDAGLVVGLSLCTTKQVCNAEFLHSYMEFARALGVGFVQWLEPRAAGRYKDQQVELTHSEYKTLDDLFLSYSFEKDYRKYPAISHPGYPQRIVGCGAAGVFNVYIDTDGNAHACPFCRKEVSSELPVIGACEKYPERVF